MITKAKNTQTKIFMGAFRWKVSPEILAFALSIYFSFFLNDVLWDDLLKTQSGSATARWAFFWAVYIAVTTIQFLIINLLFWGAVSRWLAIGLVAVTVVASYYAQAYGVHFDTTMIRNVAVTNSSEATELLTGSLALHFLMYGLLPIIGIFNLKMKSNSLTRSFLKKLFLTILSLAIAAGALLAQFKNFSAAMRNHKEIRHVVLPTSFLFSTAKVIIQATGEASAPRIPIGEDAVHSPGVGKKSELMVIVVGETVRAANWGLSGYERNTTPLLSLENKDNLFNFPYATSCGTNTETSVPCLFSVQGKHNYDEKLIKSSESLLHLVNKVGFGITWVDNQSGCKGVCAGLEFVDAKKSIGSSFCKDGNCYDEILLEKLEWAISHNAGNQVIVLHQLGNHGPAYYARYPKEFESYQPACHTSDLSACTQQEIVNAYDNSIQYTDSVLNKTINLLKKYPKKSASLIYMSDHGESLGENGIYLHGLPYSIAPKQQTQVPFFVWVSDTYKLNHPGLTNCLADQVKTPAAHDNVFHTVLAMLDIKTRLYEKNYDLTAKCHG